MYGETDELELTGMAPARVVVAMPSTGRVHHACLESVRAMIASTRRAEAVTFWWENDQPHDRCRNAILARFRREASWTHLLFVDTDVAVEPDTLDRLLAHNVDFVCAAVPCLHRRYGPPDGPKTTTVGTNIMVFDEVSRRGGTANPDEPSVGYRRVDPDDFPGQPFYCDATGLGLSLIHRAVVDALEPPWCRFVGQFDDEYVGEDVYFCRKARLAGFQIVVDPSVRCDHHKYVDLTHLDLLFADVPPVSPWPARQEPNHSDGMLVALRVPRTGWVDVRLLDVIHRWEREYGDRLRVERVFADTVRGGFAQLAGRVQTLDSTFTHVLLLGDDVMPHPATPGILASVDAPVVSALTRRLYDGRICWSYFLRDEIDGRLCAPENIRLPAMGEPFTVDSIDPVCMYLRRETLGWVGDALDDTDVDSDADVTFMQRWCDRVHGATGFKPKQAPFTVERRAEVGLAGLLRLKMRLKAELRAEMDSAGAVDAAVVV